MPTNHAPFIHTMTRRGFGKLSAAVLAGPMVGWAGASLAANPTGKPLHGLSAFGELKYPANFARFDYVNVDAPKGGTLNFGVSNWFYNQNPQTFDTLNSFVLKGNAPPRMEICFDSLMLRAVDEPTALYCRVAKTVEISPDRNSYTFKLRPEARWHDGTKLTAYDVAFSYNLLKKDGHPEIAIVLVNLESAVALDDETVLLTFNGKQADRAILTVAGMPILSKAYYDTHDFLKTSLEGPLASGPYRIKRVRAGEFVEFERVENYWARDLPFARGFYNFDVLRIEFYRERQAAFEAFKKGNVTFREEFTSKIWATEYDFPALAEGRAKKQLFDGEKLPSFQGWAVNRRRAKFADPRTAQAIGHCFDFEWTNANFFFNAYTRSQSFFQNSVFAATGEPQGDELALLKSLKHNPAPSVFEEAPIQPVTDGSGRDRKMLRKASDLFTVAGWKRRGSQLVDANGAPFTLEFLIRSPTFERILGKFVADLKTLGVDASIRLVDPAQYQLRLDTYDFDVTGLAAGYTSTPSAAALKPSYGSAYVNREGSRNYAGIADPVVDELIDKVDAAESREELISILRALDRVLRSTHSWIPNWNSANHRIAYWDMFGFPDQKPDYAFPVETTWWFDEEKAKAIGKGG